MNNFYLAKKSIKWASKFSIIDFFAWLLLIIIVVIYHFAILINSGGDAYSALKAVAPSNTSSNGENGTSETTQPVPVSSVYSTAFIQQYGLSGFFQLAFLNAGFLTISFWAIISILIFIALTTAICKYILGLFSLFTFIKTKNIFMVYASIAVIFLPLIGGIIAQEMYAAHENKISPKFITPYSFLRKRVSSALDNFREKDKKDSFFNTR